MKLGLSHWWEELGLSFFSREQGAEEEREDDVEDVGVHGIIISERPYRYRKTGRGLQQTGSE